MFKTNGSIKTHETDIIEEMLFTYSEEEKQQNEVNATNASLIFRPAVIMIFTDIQDTYDLSDVEAKLYGFIWYYLGQGGRFYFTNEQLGKVLRCAPNTVKRAVKTLTDKKVVEFSYKVKAGGGTIRFASRLVKNVPSDGTKMTRETGQKRTTNNNKINNNKINNSITNVIEKSPEIYGNEDINQLTEYFKQTFDIPKEDCTQKQSRQYWNLLIKESKTGVDGVKWLIDIAKADQFLSSNITSSKDLYYKRVKLLTRKRAKSPKVAVMPKEL